MVQKTKDWYDWFSYNAVKEPDNLRYYLNRAIETRQEKGFYENFEVDDLAYERWAPQSEFIPIARVFEISENEFENSNKKSYQKMLQKYPDVAPLITSEFRAFSPYSFLHQGMELWHPTDKQKQNAINELPYLKNKNFIHVRHDKRSNTMYSFIRKPNYYAIFNSGKIITEKQRYGLGLIWSPDFGTFFQSQSSSNLAAYGTKAEGAEMVYEALDLFPEFKLNRQILTPDEGKKDSGKEEYSTSYDLGQKGNKEINFEEERITVQVQHSGSFTEIIPFVISVDDTLISDKNKIVLQNSESSMSIAIKNGLAIHTSTIESDLNGKRIEVIEVKASGMLAYDIVFN